MQIKNGLYQSRQKEKEEQTQQRRLREKYDIEEENVRIVEKPMIGKFLLKALGTILQWLLTAVMIALVAIGIISIIYPETREALIAILYDIVSQVIRMFGGN